MKGYDFKSRIRDPRKEQKRDSLKFLKERLEQNERDFAEGAITEDKYERKKDMFSKDYEDLVNPAGGTIDDKRRLLQKISGVGGIKEYPLEDYDMPKISEVSKETYGEFEDDPMELKTPKTIEDLDKSPEELEEQPSLEDLEYPGAAMGIPMMSAPGAIRKLTRKKLRFE